MLVQGGYCRGFVALCVALCFAAGCQTSSASMTFSNAPASNDSDGGDPSVFDSNASFDRSTTLSFGDDQSIQQSITSRDDYDYFKFDGHAGQWIAIIAETESPIEVASTPLTLYDASQTQIAYNDYVRSIRGENVLSRLVVRLPSDGTYYVMVHDPAAAPASFGLIQYYRLILLDVSQTTERFAVASDGTAEPTPVAFKDWMLQPDFAQDAFLLGHFSSAADVATFAFDVADVLRLVTFQVELGGTDGNGSTTSPGAVWVTDGDGTNTIGRIDGVSGQPMLSPPLAPGHYLLHVSHPGGTVGDNDFFAVRSIMRAENTLEAADTTNGDIRGAESLDVLESGGSEEAFVTTHLGGQDIDYFRIGFTAAQVSAYCASLQEGSGVVSLHVELRDETDALLAEATESTTDRIAIENVTLPDGGALYLRATKLSQLDGVSGDWMHCGVYSF